MDFKRPKTIIALVLAVLLIIVVMQNTASVQTNILFFSFTMPRAVLLFATGAVGYGIRAFMTSLKRKKMQEDDGQNPEGDAE